MIELAEPPAISETGFAPTVEPSQGEKYILFEIGDQMFCIAASCVQEVVHPLRAASVPMRPKWLLGLGALRGEPVALIDPVTVAGTFRPLPNCKPKAIVFRTLPNQTQFALPIDSLREVIVVDHGSVKTGEFVHDGRKVRLIEHDRLFKSFERPTPQ